MVQVQVGHVTFHGFADEGFVLSPDGFVGWENAPSSRRTDTPRPGGHGSFRTPVFKNGRLVTLSGTVLASDERQLVAFADDLAGISYGERRMVVSTETGVRWADVTGEGEPKFDRIGGALEASFQIQFFAADPRKYGELREFVSTGSNVAAWHRGNFPASPIFEGTGFTAGYRVVGPGGTFTVPGPKASATVDRIDFSTGLFTRNGAPAVRAATQVRMWDVPPGANVSWRVEPLSSGTGTARMFLTDTWI